MSSKIEDAEAGGWSADADDANMEAVARLYNKVEDYKLLYQQERLISLDRLQRLAAVEKERDELCDAGVPTVLFCPYCHHLHVDEGEWATRPHRTHECQHCKTTWRPFEVATYGIDPGAETFEQAWARMEAEGYQYGGDALENVRFGFELARGSKHAAQTAADFVAERDELRDLLELLDRGGGLGLDVHSRIRVALGKAPL